MEIWKDVKGYEGMYQVSSLGNVKSLERIVLKNGLYPFIHKELILKAAKNTHGYYYVRLSKDGKAKNKLVHQLVAIEFLNHIPNGFNLVVNHKDINRQNNNIDNLEIVTSRENSNLKHIKSSSQYVGVRWHKASRKWHAAISIKKESTHLGCFDDEYDAHIAYQNKLKEITEKE